MTHALLLVGRWAGAAAADRVPSHFGMPQILALALTLAVLAALWRLAERHHRELRARRDSCVVAFPGPSGRHSSGPAAEASGPS